MSLVSLREILPQLENDGRAIGAFSVGNMEMVIGALLAGEELNTPIILQVAEVRLTHSPLELIGPMMVSAAKKSSVPVVVHFDHGLTPERIQTALEIGFNSIMFDGSHLSLEENIRNTNQVISMAQQYHATVEGEVGVVGGSEDGTRSYGIKYSDVSEVKRFEQQTKVDTLAVAIGNAHGRYVGEPHLSFKVLNDIHQVVQTPLVLHGGTGISDEDFKKAIHLGIRKVNIATSNFESVIQQLKAYETENRITSFFKLNEAMVEGTYNSVKKYIKVFNNIN